MKILFYGTPDFAVASLEKLIEAGKNIIGVVTAPDKPAGRGYHLQQSAVKKYALAQNIAVYQPTNMKSAAFQDTLSKINPDLQIVVAFRMMPASVWDFPKLGTFNLHGSLLPSYRGAAPINWAVINGDKKTGVSTFFLVHEIDTGSVILQDELAIGENDTAGKIHDKLMTVGASLVLKTVELIENGKATTTSQKDLIEKGYTVSHAPKLNKALCKLNPSDNIHQLHNKIRGLSPFPGSFFKISLKEKNRIFKVFRSEVVSKKTSNSTMLIEDGSKLYFQNSSGTLHLKEIQLEGKRRMTDEEFLKGVKLDTIKILEE